jgi:hypothetical protein
VFNCGYMEVSSSQIRLRGIQGNCDQFPGVPLIHLYNGCVETDVYRTVHRDIFL